MYSIFIDGIKVKKMTNSKTYYTWFLCVDGTVRCVSTYLYNTDRFDPRYKDLYFESIIPN